MSSIQFEELINNVLHTWKKSTQGVVVFIVGPDQEEIGIIVALGIQERLGLKGESERFDAFTRMNLFLEEM